MKGMWHENKRKKDDWEAKGYGVGVDLGCTRQPPPPTSNPNQSTMNALLPFLFFQSILSSPSHFYSHN